MPHRRLPVRRAFLLSVACLLAGPAVLAASADAPGRLAMLDAVGDANAVNDQGEGLVGNVAVGWQVPQADLRRVALLPLTVEVPYAALPAQAQAGAVAHSVAAYVRTAPFGDLNRAKPGQLDGVRTSLRYAFPG